MFIAAVLFPRSHEPWRIGGGEKRKSTRLEFPHSGAFRREARKYWGLSTLEIREERFFQGTTGGGRGAGTELSGRDEAKSLVRLRKMAIGSVYAGLRSFPPGRDWKLQMSSETPLLVNGRDGLSIPHVAEVPFLSAIGKQPGVKHGRTFPALITNASVDDSTGGLLPVP